MTFRRSSLLGLRKFSKNFKNLLISVSKVEPLVTMLPLSSRRYSHRLRTVLVAFWSLLKRSTWHCARAALRPSSDLAVVANPRCCTFFQQWTPITKAIYSLIGALGSGPNLAAALGVRGEPALTPLSNAPEGMSTGHKRCSNRLLHASGYELIYPDYRSGYGAVLAA